VFVPRTEACGNTQGRTCEPLEGNVTTDAMRTTYGTDFAITNSGGLRADLTCPTTQSHRLGAEVQHRTRWIGGR
jgi:5'-nucleotidase, C-terminal domain